MKPEDMVDNLLNHKTYLFSLDYGDRKNEREFVKDVLDRFDRFQMTGCGLFINNNPYNLELYFCLSFEKDDKDFESWLSKHHPHKVRAYNIFVNELIEAAFRKGYSLATFLDSANVDDIMTVNKNELFLFPDRDVMYDIWGRPVIEKKKKIFLSHSSRDKNIVDTYFNEIQKSELKAWYDKEEIIAGDSITAKVSEGLDDCELGVIFLSNNFLSKHSGWTEAECNYFITRRMKKNKTLIVVNLGVEHDNMPPLLQDYLYIDASRDNAESDLIHAIRKQLERI
ncbi:toll/interleukin-1 receptor domain-containing protein [Vibrio parahaemolyticus]|nr:toll/interleukin-1 receptor domain-containing protein [Vibrio parahaemolyticus]MDF4335940.1 toll/interleukin-1 receptor domain-containing protein [Vibrio parahaemolyticus]